MMISKQYCGFKVIQRESEDAVQFFVFAASPKDILRWSTVDRLEEREGGIQRRMSQARVRALSRFFNMDPRNVIPTSVIVAFGPGVTHFTRLEPGIGDLACDDQPEVFMQWGILEFEYDPDQPVTERPALIVDGQHRLHGMAQVEGEELPVIVSALLDAGTNEQAFQFIVINNKVTRVPTDLVRSLIVDFNEDALQERLETARISLRTQALLVAVVDDEQESPFCQMVSWERRRGEGTPAVKPAAIEASFKYIERSFPSLEEDQDALIDFFFAMWNGVRESYPELWEETDNRLFENAGFKAFSEFLTDQLEMLAGIDIDFVDIFELASVRSATYTIASKITVEFWLSGWNLKSLDTSAGREIVKDDLKRIRQNRKEERVWWEGLKLVGMQDAE